MAAIIYTRFSPGADSEASRSGEVQREQCEFWCFKNKISIDEVFSDESASGADEAREALWDAINALKKGDVLVVYNRDRLARSLFLAEYIRRKVAEKGARIVAITGDIDGDSPENVLIRQVLDAVSEYERKIIARRTSHSMRELQRQGYKVGGHPPFGWTTDPTGLSLVPVEREQATLKKMYELRDQGLGYNRIAQQLNEKSNTHPRAGLWAAGTIRRVVIRRDRMPTI